MAKISIIIPIYKVEKYIDKCIKSVLNQTFQDIEVILVNDGSPDKCGEICDYYTQEDDRIIVIHKDNGGLSSARNEGIDKATGDYIAFVDGDDYIEEDMYSVMYEEAKITNADVVICDFMQVDEQGEYLYNDDSRELKSRIMNRNDNILCELYNGNMTQFVVAWNKLYKREIFSDIRYDEGRIHEDEFIIHKILHKCELVSCIDKKMYNYVIRKDSITTSTFSKKKFDIIYAFHERMIFFRKNNINELIFEAEYAYINSFFKYYYLGKEQLENIEQELYDLRKYFKQGLKYFLKNPKYNRKEKLIWILFYIQPRLYELYFKVFTKNGP